MREPQDECSSCIVLGRHGRDRAAFCNSQSFFPAVAASLFSADSCMQLNNGPMRPIDGWTLMADWTRCFTFADFQGMH